MLRNLYERNQYFLNLLACNIFWTAIKIIQWSEIKPEIAGVIIKYNAIEFVFVTGICMLMIPIYKWAGNQKTYINISVFILFSIVGPCLLFIFSNVFKHFYWPEGIFTELNFKAMKASVYYQLMFFIALGGIVYLTRSRKNFILQKEAAIKADALVKDTQLKMLRYQINPHFLFNTLNSLHALVDEDKEIAKKLIIDMSEYYRSTLDKQIQKHSISNEVAIIEKYLTIQKVRFEENFDYHVSIDKMAVDIEVPIFIVHLLIENALKYGLKTVKDRLIINLNISIEDNILTIRVKNTGRIPDPQRNVSERKNGTNSGIDNITKRLKLYYGSNYFFSLVEENSWVIATIRITNI